MSIDRSHESPLTTDVGAAVARPAPVAGSPAAAADSLDLAPLDRTSPLPLWAQLLERLQQGVEEGRFTERFPTELELTVAFEVSRHTVREAIRRLEQDGVVTRYRGRGTFVTGAEFRQPLGTLYSLFRSVEQQGIEQTSEVLAKEITTNEEVAAKLGLAADAPLVYLERIRYAGTDPLALDRAWLPASIAAPILEADFRRAALYDELATRCGITPDGGHEEIRPVALDEEQCTRLPLEPGHAMFSIERLTRSGGRIIEWRQSFVRGDRFSFVAEWSSHGESTTPEVVVHDLVPTGG